MNPAFNSGQADGVVLLRPMTWGNQNGWASHQAVIVHCRKGDYTVHNIGVEMGIVRFTVQVWRGKIPGMDAGQGPYSPHCLWGHENSLWILSCLMPEHSSIKYLCDLIYWCGLLLTLLARMGHAYCWCCGTVTSGLLSDWGVAHSLRDCWPLW